MPKNIVVYSDGTGQDGGVRPEQRISNVYKMYRATRIHPDNAIDPSQQVCFYDPGLGTDVGATALTAPVRFVQKLLASVTGRGITRNIAECYEFIINHFEEGDRIFLIGFSRGAYTVRSLANLLMLCGVPTADAGAPLFRFRKRTRDIAREAVDTVLEHGAGNPRAEFEDERFEMARRFRAKYGSDSKTSPGDSNVAAYFIGVFDTVAALGARGMWRFVIQAGLALFFTIGIALPLSLLAAAIAGLLKAITGFPFWWSVLGVTVLLVALANVWFWRRQRLSYKKTIRDFPKPGDMHSHYAEWKAENFDRLLSKHVAHARSANAIDETRKDFDRVAWGSAGQEQHLKQMWFAGNHSDIGGSYPEVESRLSDIALQWMIEEAVAVPQGLKIGPVTSNGTRLPGTGEEGTPLHLFPSAAGLQHCEIAGTRDTLDEYAARLPGFMRGYISTLNYQTIIRTVRPDAKLHPTVLERLALALAPQTAKEGHYRPEALRNHQDCKSFYEPQPGPGAQLAGPVEPSTLQTGT
jgi:uncharacterized protein (DUF2235 family)